MEAVLRENEGRGHVWDLESQAKAMLNRLGIPDFNASVDTFSAGRKRGRHWPRSFFPRRIF